LEVSFLLNEQDFCQALHCITNFFWCQTATWDSQETIAILGIQLKSTAICQFETGFSRCGQ
jgi:hypothetical protein